ncbi:MAG: hypothetical protein LBL92_03045 [Propionibacteriaceae bacterium]|jgi:hypothetical protein|nr:hypothetical protein [Propionibacteriaceae bacterium]
MRAFLSATLAATGLLLAGCATVAPNTSLPATSSASATASSASALSEKPVTLKAGQPVDLSATRGLVKATVTIDSVTLGATCASAEETPQLGQFVAVHLTAVQGQDPTFEMATYEWLVVGVDGVEHDARATVVTGRCVPEAERLTNQYDTTGRVTGTVLLDAPVALSRILVRNPLAVPPVTITIELPPPG